MSLSAKEGHNTGLEIFSDPSLNVYAVLDGASVPNLLGNLEKFHAEYICLYRGELDPELAEAAPYLVALTQGSDLAEWVISGLGSHWGIYAVTNANLTELRKHFRTFLMVYSPEGMPLYFRYYDPRVFRTYLPTCNADESAQIYGPVKKYYVEGENGDLLCFHAGMAELDRSI